MALRLSGGRRLQSPKGEVARPTTGRVRAAVMNMLADRLGDCSWLELCGGSGVMACEVLQRGAAVVVLVEKDRRVATVARANLELVVAAQTTAGVRQPQVKVVEEEALRFLRRGVASSGYKPFNLIYADPPWASGLHGPLAEAVMAGGWLAPGGVMVWEAMKGSGLQIPMGWREQRRRAYGTSELVILALGEDQWKEDEALPRNTEEGLHP